MCVSVCVCVCVCECVCVCVCVCACVYLAMAASVPSICFNDGCISAPKKSSSSSYVSHDVA